MEMTHAQELTQEKPWIMWWTTEEGKRRWWRCSTQESAHAMCDKHNAECTRRGELMQRGLVGYDADGAEFPIKSHRIWMGAGDPPDRPHEDEEPIKKVLTKDTLVYSQRVVEEILGHRSRALEEIVASHTWLLEEVKIIRLQAARIQELEELVQAEFDAAGDKRTE